MKFNVQSKALYTQASAVSKVINSKNPMPILNNFLLELKDGMLYITASDTENILTARVPVLEAEGEGKFCVDARRLTDLLKSMPDIGITFNINDDNLAIEVTYNGDKGKFDFIGINGNEYPVTAIGHEEGCIRFTAPAEQILSGIDSTMFAVGTDQLRPQMMGIFWDVKPDSITFVATDTRKLVKFRTQQSAPEVTGSCIMPVKPSTVIRNVFPRETAINITIDSKRATLESDDITFSCQLIKGNFPDYNRVIPTTNPYSMTVDRGSMLSALKRVSVFGDQGQNQVKMKITPEEVTIKAVDNNYCTKGMETISCDFNHQEMVIGFSAPYLIEFFSTIPTEDVHIDLSDPSRPGVFMPSEQKADSELLMLLMPMNVSEF